MYYVVRIIQGATIAVNMETKIHMNYTVINATVNTDAKLATNKVLQHFVLFFNTLSTPRTGNR